MYNNGLTIDRALKSVAIQQPLDIEIIIIDDGSNDDGWTIAIASIHQYGFNHYKVIRNITNQGAYFSRNLAIQFASKNFVLFLDADDEFTSDCFKTLSETIDRSDADIVFFDILLKREGAHDQIMHILTNTRQDIQWFDYVKALPSPCNKLVKRSIYVDNTIAFPNTIYEDLATSYRLVLASKEITYIPQSLYIYHKADSGNVSSITDQRITQLYDVIESMMDDLTNDVHGFTREQLANIVIPALMNQYLMVLTIDDQALVKSFYNRSIALFNHYFDHSWSTHVYFHPGNIKQKLIRSMLKSKWSYRIINRISFCRSYIRTNYHL